MTLKIYRRYLKKCAFPASSVFIQAEVQHQQKDDVHANVCLCFSFLIFTKAFPFCSKVSHDLLPCVV